MWQFALIIHKAHHFHCLQNSCNDKRTSKCIEGSSGRCMGIQIDLKMHEILQAYEDSA